MEFNGGSKARRACVRCARMQSRVVEAVRRAVALTGFCSGGGSEVWVYRGSRVRSPPVPVVLSVYQRGPLLDGLAMYLSCVTNKFHDNESTHILHNFWTSNTHIGGSFPPRPPGGATGVACTLTEPATGRR